jgi:hypothetical protein
MSAVRVPKRAYRKPRARGPIWYAKYRLPDGRQIKKKIVPAWTGRGRPAGGCVTKRLAEDWLLNLRKRSTVATYRALLGSQILPALAERT